MAGLHRVTVGGNAWREASVDPGAGHDSLVSVVIPHYLSEGALAITLAGLARQDHPAELLEVIVVDDGSDPPLELPDPPLPVTLIHQSRDGFGAGRARNRGAASAKGEIILFLDADMVPDPGWTSAHAAWHSSYHDVLTVGFRTHVDFDGISPSDVAEEEIAELVAARPTQVPEWIEGHMERTDDLSSDDDDLFRVVTAGNFGIRRELFEWIGGFDERFTSWGAEDTELGYRAFNAGALLVPVREAHAWHQGLAGGLPDDHEARSLDVQRAKSAHLIAHHGFRRNVPGRSYEVARLAVHLGADRPPEEVLTDLERILASRWHDLVVVLDIDQSNVDGQWLAAQVEADPRVVLGSPAPATPLHLEIEASAQVREDTIGAILEQARDRGVATIVSDGTPIARLYSTRSRCRAAGLGQADWFEEAGRLFGAVEIDARDVGWSTGGSVLRTGSVRSKVSQDSSLNKLYRRARQVRSTRDAASLARWVGNAVRYRVTGRTVLPPVARIGGSVGPEPTSTRPLGVAVGTRGTRAAAILGASARVVRKVDGSHPVDLLLVDMASDNDPTDVAMLSLGGEDPVRGIASVAAIDPEHANPIGWPLHPSDGAVVVAAAGTAWDALPAVISGLAEPVSVLVAKDREVRQEPPGLVRTDDPVGVARFARSAIDLPQLHRHPAERAAHIVTLAAAGVLVRVVDPEPELEGLLGSDLWSAVTSGSVPTDLTERELVSVRQRRAALRDHSLNARVRQLVARTDLAPLDVPPVSVLMSTNRPDFLTAAIQSVARQTYPRVELVLALHGGGFGGAVEPLLADLDVPHQVVRVAHEMTLGDALNMAGSASSGTLVTKFDDDDHYGPDHIWDLVLARGYARAELVGKAAEFVHLSGSDITVRRFAGRAESYTTTIGGGAMLISRHDLDEAGGWRRIPRRVDRALVEDVEAIGGSIYRTHGFGYVLVRHGEGHTWEEEDQYFLDQADAQRDGLALEWAGVE